MRVCKFEDCGKKVRTFGLCTGHYNQSLKGQELRPLQQLYRGKLCYGPECDRVATRKSLCGGHYAIYRRGEELRPLKLEYAVTRDMTIAERMEHYSSAPNQTGCVLWTGAKNSRNYPVIHGSGEMGTNLAHRVAYIIATGDNPEPHEPIHHKCGQSLCIEPSHLQKVESWENSAEMLERTFYKRRIAQLEDALRFLNPEHELLSQFEELERNAA